MKAYEFREMLDGRIGLIIYFGLLIALVATSLTTTISWIIPFVFLISLLIFYNYDDTELLVISMIVSIGFYLFGLGVSTLVIKGSELNTKKTTNEYQVKLIENEKIIYGDKLTVTSEPKLYWKCKAINCTKVIETIETREPDFVHNSLLIFTKTELDVK